MSQLEWQEELAPAPPGDYGTSRGYTLTGSEITATLTKVYSGDWVLYCEPLGVGTYFTDEPERSIDELLQDAKAHLLKTAEKKLRDLQAFVDQISVCNSPAVTLAGDP